MAAATTPTFLYDAVHTRAKAFAAQLRTVGHGSTAVPNLDWTVADLGQHVACLPAYWEGQSLSGPVFDRPDDFAAFSDQARAHITETDPTVLADLVESEFDRYLEQFDTDDERWLYGRTCSATNICGSAINELFQHGRDLAAVTGASVPGLDSREANAAVDVMMITTPAFVDEAKASAQPDGTYHVRFRGGNDYTWTKTGDQLTIELGRPAKADAHLVADPEMFLLSSLGRVSQVRAGLSGKMFVYGKRPWRFLGLGTIAVDGV